MAAVRAVGAILASPTADALGTGNSILASARLTRALGSRLQAPTRLCLQAPAWALLCVRLRPRKPTRTLPVASVCTQSGWLRRGC